MSGGQPSHSASETDRLLYNEWWRQSTDQVLAMCSRSNVSMSQNDDGYSSGVGHLLKSLICDDFVLVMLLAVGLSAYGVAEEDDFRHLPLLVLLVSMLLLSSITTLTYRLRIFSRQLRDYLWKENDSALYTVHRYPDQTLHVHASGLREGDLLQLNRGMCIPADVRIVENSGLRFLPAAIDMTPSECRVASTEVCFVSSQCRIENACHVALFGSQVEIGSGEAWVAAVGRNTQRAAAWRHLKIASMQRASDAEKEGRVIVKFTSGLSVALLATVLAVDWKCGHSSEHEMLRVVVVAALVSTVPFALPFCLQYGIWKLWNEIKQKGLMPTNKAVPVELRHVQAIFTVRDGSFKPVRERAGPDVCLPQTVQLGSRSLLFCDSPTDIGIAINAVLLLGTEDKSIPFIYVRQFDMGFQNKGLAPPSLIACAGGLSLDQLCEAIEHSRNMFARLRKVVIAVLPTGSVCRWIPLLMHVVSCGVVPLSLNAFHMILLALFDVALSVSLVYDEKSFGSIESFWKDCVPASAGTAVGTTVMDARVSVLWSKGSLCYSCVFLGLYHLITGFAVFYFYLFMHSDCNLWRGESCSNVRDDYGSQEIYFATVLFTQIAAVFCVSRGLSPMLSWADSFWSLRGAKMRACIFLAAVATCGLSFYVHTAAAVDFGAQYVDVRYLPLCLGPGVLLLLIHVVFRVLYRRCKPRCRS